MENEKSIIPLLKTVPLFEGLPPQQLQELVRIVQDRQYERGQAIFTEGDQGVGFFVVVSGRVKIFMVSPEGKEQILHLLGVGEPFGEVAVFSGQQFPANAEALEKSRVLFFPQQAFTELVRHDPNLALNMLAVLSRRLRRFASLIDDLSLKEVPGRLAAYLLYLSEQKDGARVFTLQITKGQLASLLGTIPETLSRILAKMGRQGLIEADGNRINLLDTGGLRKLADADHRL